MSKAYMLEKPPPPSPAKRFVDQRATPILIDAAAAVEQRLERLAMAAKRAPLTSLAAAFAIGCLLRTARRLPG